MPFLPTASSGASWHDFVNAGTSAFERVIYAFPAVDPRPGNGTIYMLWLDYARNQIFVAKSVDGGLSWGTNVAAETTHIGFAVDISCNGGRGATPSPQMGIDGNGVIYITYADEIGADTGLDIFFVQSFDDGATWTPAVKVNDDHDRAHHYNAALSVLPDTTGTIYISWYDRRNDPDNCLSNIFATVSTDSGGTFSFNTRVTPTASDYDFNPNGPGDYSGNAPFGANTAFPVWCSRLSSDIAKQTGLDGSYEIYTAPVSH